MAKWLWASVVGCAALSGLGCSYKSDVEKLCKAKETCAEAFEEEAILREERDELVGDCLGGKLYSSEGRELFAALSAQYSPREKFAMLAAAAKKAGLASCGWADDFLTDLNLPKAPAGCDPLPADAPGVEVTFGDTAVHTGCAGIVVQLPSEAKLSKGFDDRFKPKGKPESFEIEPIRDSVKSCRYMAVAVARAKGSDPSALPALLYVHKRHHPLPKLIGQQLAHSLKAADLEEVRQVFLSEQGLCTTPYVPGS